MTLLTKPACPLCDEAKQALDRLARDFDLAIELVAIDSERGRALAAAAGLPFPPGVLVDGQPFSYGRLSERKLRRALEGRRRR